MQIRIQSILALSLLIGPSSSGQVPRPPAPEATWKNRRPSEWTDQEAQQILVHSPWARTIRAALLPELSEAQRRAGGNMGRTRGVGADGLEGADEGKPKLSSVGTVLGGAAPVQPASRGVVVLVRWESAAPVRTAELKAHVIEPPTLEGEGYRIAVYGIPGGAFKGDPLQLGEPLKKVALLKRESKKPVKPVRVEVFQREDGLAVVYLFPMSAEISPADQAVEFECQIGRLYVSHSFPLADMVYAGKLEL
jgi:hypothetical protein